MEHQLRDDRTAWAGPLISPASGVGFGPRVNVGVVGQGLGKSGWEAGFTHTAALWTPLVICTGAVLWKMIASNRVIVRAAPCQEEERG
jgi:hypothetical protein